MVSVSDIPTGQRWQPLRAALASLFFTFFRTRPARRDTSSLQPTAVAAFPALVRKLLSCGLLSLPI